MQVRVGWAARAALHGLTTRTDGLPVVYFPPSVCKVRGVETATRTNLHNHDCERRLELAAPPPLASRKRLAAWRQDHCCAPEMKRTHEETQRLGARLRPGLS